MGTRKFNRNREVITAPLLFEFGRLGLNFREISDRLGVDRHTLSNHMEKDPELREAYYRGKGSGDTELRTLQWKKARQKGAGSVAMVIHMSKHRLGEHDRALNEVHIKAADPITEMLKLIDGAGRGLPDPSKIPHDDRLIDVTPLSTAASAADFESEDAGSSPAGAAPLPDQSKIPEDPR